MLWASYRKRKALRSYRSLGSKLRGTYGTRRHYRPEEVEYVARAHHYNPDYLCYAFAMYCDAEAFGLYHAARGEACDYEVMRHEVGERLFGGDTSFDGSTLTDPSHAHAADAGCPDGDGADGGGVESGFDGGGFDGGGCDGGGGD